MVLKECCGFKLSSLSHSHMMFVNSLEVLFYRVSGILVSHLFVHFIPAGFCFFYLGQRAAQDCV